MTPLWTCHLHPSWCAAPSNLEIMKTSQLALLAQGAISMRRYNFSGCFSSERETEVTGCMQVGQILGDFLASSPDSLAAIGGAVQKAGVSSEDYVEGSDPPLIDSGLASEVMANALETFATQSGREEAAAAWKACNLRLQEFLPSVRKLHYFATLQ